MFLNPSVNSFNLSAQVETFANSVVHLPVVPHTGVNASNGSLLWRHNRSETYFGPGGADAELKAFLLTPAVGMKDERFKS